jgi:hypothetical protein
MNGMRSRYHKVGPGVEVDRRPVMSDLGIEEGLADLEQEDTPESESDAPRAIRPSPPKRRRATQRDPGRRRWASESSERVYSVLLVMIGDGGRWAKCWFAKMRQLDGGTLQALRSVAGTEQSEADLVTKIGLKDPRWNAITLPKISMTTWQRVYVVLPPRRHQQGGQPLRSLPIE